MSRLQKGREFRLRQDKISVVFHFELLMKNYWSAKWCLGKAHDMRFYVFVGYKTWWRHQMETFSALLAICAGNSPVPGEFPTQRPVTRSFGVFFDLRLNKRLSKQSWGWWFESLSHPLWRHRNEMMCMHISALSFWCSTCEILDVVSVSKNR